MKPGILLTIWAACTFPITLAAYICQTAVGGKALKMQGNWLLQLADKIERWNKRRTAQRAERKAASKNEI